MSSGPRVCPHGRRRHDAWRAWRFLVYLRMLGHNRAACLGSQRERRCKLRSLALFFDQFLHQFHVTIELPSMLRCCALRCWHLRGSCTADGSSAHPCDGDAAADVGASSFSAAKDDGATLPGATYDVLHEDDDILVVDKGAGLLFVPGGSRTRHDSLISRVQMTHGDAVGVAHRLDRDTSGVCVLAKTKAALGP